MRKFTLHNLQDHIPHLDEEEHLVRLNLIGFGSPAHVLLYLFRFRLGYSPPDIVAELFDLPLWSVEELAETQLAHAVSELAVDTYLAPLRAKLNRICAEVLREQTTNQSTASKPGQRLGETTLRNHFSTEPRQLLQEAAVFASHVRSQRFSWRNADAFDIFCQARQKDIYNHILVRVGYNHDVAAELSQETWLAVQKKRRRYRRARGKFIAFVKDWANTMVLRHYAASKKQFDKLLPLDEAAEMASALAHFQSTSIFEELDQNTIDTIHLELLEILFSGKSPPHRLLTFIFCRLFKWKPKKIIAKLFPKTLREIAEQAEQHFLRVSELPCDRVLANFKKLHAQMDKRFEQVVTGKKKRKDYAHLLRAIVGDTRQGAYFLVEDEAERAAKVVNAWSGERKRLTADVRKKAKGLLRELVKELCAKSDKSKKGKSKKNSPKVRPSAKPPPTWPVKKGKPRRQGKKRNT